MNTQCLILSAICIFVSMNQVFSFSSSVRSFPRQTSSQLYMAGFGAKKEVVDGAKTTARVADAAAPCKFSTVHSTFHFTFLHSDANSDNRIRLTEFYLSGSMSL